MKAYLICAAALLLLTGCGRTAADSPTQESAAEAGDTVRFGGYEWYVIGRTESTETLLCRDTVCAMPYHDGEGDITWEACTLRQWLNTDFYRTFTEDERAQILPTECENPDNTEYIGTVTPGGSTTEDYVFLLSIEEARALRPELRACDRYWWLRSPGKHSYYAAGVYSSGEIDALGYFANYTGYESAVRPALRILRPEGSARASGFDGSASGG